MSMNIDDFDAYIESLEGELLPDICIGSNASGLPCCGDVAYTDALGQPWCEKHVDNYEFINWGKAHNWPDVVYGDFEIAEGITNWMITATFGNGDRVCELFAEAVGNLEEVA